MNKLFKPSDYFILFAALVSMGISIGFWFSGYKDEGVYIGIWVPSILGFGNYVKNLLIQNKESKKDV